MEVEGSETYYCVNCDKQLESDEVFSNSMFPEDTYCQYCGSEVDEIDN